jgi:hypothetical protein
MNTELEETKVGVKRQTGHKNWPSAKILFSKSKSSYQWIFAFKARCDMIVSTLPDYLRITVPFFFGKKQ